jgi:hypothetical protein
MRLDLADENKKFKPTVQDCQYWFSILNDQIFSGKLPMVRMKVKKLKGDHASIVYWRKSDNKPKDCVHLEFNTSFKSKKLFVEIMAHEMIHLFQYYYDEPLGHGPSFWAWRDNLKIKGLTLHKVA